MYIENSLDVKMPFSLLTVQFSSPLSTCHTFACRTPVFPSLRDHRQMYPGGYTSSLPTHITAFVNSSQPASISRWLTVCQGSGF